MNLENIKFSFCISSSGREQLLGKCIRSIRSLELSNYEILIGSSVEFNFESKPNIAYFKTQAHVGKTRNKLKSEAKGDWLIFIDEDIQIPNEGLISHLVRLDQQEQADIYGGFYTSYKNQSIIDRAYNMTCNLWVQRGKSLQSHVLGGIYILKGNKFPDYFDAYSFGGEEYPYFSELSKLKYKVHISNKINVTHTPGHSFKSFFKRAWLHGKFKPIDKIKGNRVSLFIQYNEQFHIKFFAGLYFFVVYISQFFNKLQSSYLFLLEKNTTIK